MKNICKRLIQIFCLCLFIWSCSNQPTRDLYPEELIGGFELLPSTMTGIDFSNTINESKMFHHYFFSQIYLGSGVAIGDINNDGLADVFFGGNQVADRLYLNKGNFQFEDITKKSKVARNSGWTWGVSMVDINSDGYLDIYVSRNGNSLKLEDRRNQLYINNQDLTFTESAQKYGLADIGFSTEAVFFDMDNDGDLDMYLVNQPADKKVLLTNKVTQRDAESFKDRLYRNENGRFRDISERSGISRELAYGLSVSASDFNNDGFIDLYVANDYAQPDFMYYNNGDGTFTNVINEQLRHITQLSMGSDTGDINNDGLIDLITTDMTPEDHYRSKTNMASMSTEAFNMMVDAGAHYQYMTNTLQINTGMGTFSDIGNMAGMAYTDWSWSSLMVDLDNDGLKDILVSNGIKKDVDNNDYKSILNSLNKDSTTVDYLFEISKNAPSQPISNYAFKNKGDFEFQKMTKEWGFSTPSFSNGMAYGDLDNDGDLDVVVNNIQSEAFVYRNNATGNFLKIKLEGSMNNKFGYGAKAIIYHNGKKQIAENLVTRGYFSSVEPQLLFGLGKDTMIEKVEVIWPNGKVNVFENIKANRVIEADIADAKAIRIQKEKSDPFFENIDVQDLGLDFTHKENEYDDWKEQILLPHRLSQNGPFSATGDINGDGLEDMFVGGAKDQSGVLYIQNSSGKFSKNSSQPWNSDSGSEDLGCLFFDADGDKDLDLYVASGGNEFKLGDNALLDRLYINDGVGNFSRDLRALPSIKQSSQSVASSDIDNDGDLDLFVGTRLIPGQYTFPADSYLLINENGKFRKASTERAPALENIGMVTDAVFTDINKDGTQDLMIVGEWMEVKVLLNENGNFEDNSTDFGLEDTRGIWWSITAADLDGDGDEDYVLGNLGKNNKFKASEEHPFKVYANDFDNNGTNDVVLAKFYKDDYVPVRGRECTSQQMPYVAEKFEDYHSFASSKLFEILPEDKVDDAVIYEIKSFESIVLINEGDHFVKRLLPTAVQISPIKSSLVTDVNKDGIMDIVLAGNHYGVEVETTRYDAGYGAVLLGTSDGNYVVQSPKQSGFYVPFDSRNLSQITINGKESIVVTNNNDQLKIFSTKG
ncbi:VCBS repeat-containing protein [Winogradskyella vincentii]|uniref:VCBS repeat-containing protein n=1 Tax=Winogradskyella vincentii TaxID=2877122 RepID=A0ABS7Y4C7_9FLAO|nr:VCBS repeat-containing protein [Winogradskyella vincentii]MCA0154140.1 VCBS repeat-containing protein [Winogradskyella vincentii]